MSRWFRFYDDVINDPKVLKLPENSRWMWVAVLCVASKGKGKLPSLADTAFMLRTTEAKTKTILATLVHAGLLDEVDGEYAPHNWGGRQFLSDSSAERVKRHREKREAAGLISQWTAPKPLRKAVYLRDNHECVYCGSADDLTLDHKLPEARGGTHDIANLQTACRKCNASKRDLTHDEYVTRNEHVTLLKRPQSTEQNTEAEPEKESGGAVAPPDEIVVPIRPYAFAGRIIRIDQNQLQTWKQNYHALPDITATLQSADDYYSENPPKDRKWFFPVSRWLQKEHDKIVAERERQRMEARSF